jgi:hypothetical protein
MPDYLQMLNLPGYDAANTRTHVWEGPPMDPEWKAMLGQVEITYDFSEDGTMSTTVTGPEEVARAVAERIAQAQERV